MPIPRWAMENASGLAPTDGAPPWWSLENQPPQQQADFRNPYMTRTADPAAGTSPMSGLAGMVQDATGWRPGTTPSWMPQWATDLSASNNAAEQAQQEQFAKWGISPEDMNVAMSFGMGSIREPRGRMRVPDHLMGKPYVEAMGTPNVAPTPSAQAEIQALRGQQGFADATGGGESRISGRDALINRSVNQGKDLVNSPEWKAWAKGGRKGRPPTTVKPAEPVVDPYASDLPPSRPSLEDWQKATAGMNNNAAMSWDLDDVLAALKGGK